MRLRLCVMAALMVPLLGVGVPAAQASPGTLGVTVGLTPAVQQVTPGAVFDLYFQVTQAGDPFNGFDAVIGFDPAALTRLPLSQAEQEGTYMREACGNTFYVYKAGASTDTITDVLLCGGVALPGPGQLFHLRFQASNTPQVTAVHFLPGLQFYNAGIYVKPVYSTDARIGIGMPVSVGPTGPVRLTLAVAPNPSRGNLLFTVGADRAGPESLAVFDLQDRMVRRFAETRSEPGVRAVTWDGCSDTGVRLAPGVYLARLEVAGRAVWRRVTLIR